MRQIIRSVISCAYCISAASPCWAQVDAEAAQPKSYVFCYAIVALGIALGLVALLLLNAKYFVPWSWSRLTWIAVVALPLTVLVCQFLSRRQACRVAAQASTSRSES